MALSSVPESSQDGRAFLQQRLALFGKSFLLLFLGIAGLGFGSMLLLMPEVFSEFREPPYHILAILGVAVLWLVCRRGERSMRTLLVLEVVVVLMVGAGIAHTIRVGAPVMLPAVPATLGLTHLLIARAIMVPSDWRRTLWISGLAATPTIAFIAADAAGGTTLMHPLWSIMLPAWCLLAVVTATWTSHVIYRLRRHVIEARTLGQYTLEEKIGEGGMGVVYRARHAMLRRPTVVKLLPQEKAGDANVARFEREVQLTSQLTSANTVAIYDFGRTPDGIFYYAMEYLDGIDLEKLVAEAGPQPPSRVIHILAQACVALAEAHEACLIHRDIKPSNIMLCRHGGCFDVVKVLDFGLVKDIAGGGDVRLTHADTVLGTPLFLSPEAITDPAAVDARADLYALGAVGYFLLTGKHVFEGRTVAEVSAHHIHSAPVPPSRDVAVPGDLEAALLACLAKSPAERPASARALRARLLACVDAGGWSDQDAWRWWRVRGPTRLPTDSELAATPAAAAR
jgi:serine/threonine-protein kinase